MYEEKEFCILIVDDDRFNVNVLSNILKPHYKILIADSGSVAIELSISHKPDLILLDIIMPTTNGFDTLRQLKNIEETMNIPVIFITGLDSIEDEEKGLFLGAVDYIRKPFHNSIINARVKTHLKIVKQMRLIEQSIMIDFLLDIPNRRYFDKQIQLEWLKAIRKAYPISLLMIDVDYFKEYNDTYGHPQGDILLQSVAKTLSDTVAKSNGIVTRYGGDEFIVILPDSELDGAMDLAEKIRRGVQNNETILCETKKIRITVSIGVASCAPKANDNWTDLLAKGDNALYKAKESGRNTICFIDTI